MINGTSCSRMNYNQGIISGKLVFLMGAHVEPLHAAVTSMRLLAFNAKAFPVIADHFSSLRQLLKESSLRSQKGEEK